MFNQDFNELLSIFNDHKVKYLVVEGYAVGFHSQPRATKDLVDVDAIRMAAESQEGDTVST